MAGSIKKLGPLSVGLWFGAWLSQMGAAQAWEPACAGDGTAPEVAIEEPVFGTITDASEITVTGTVREACSLAKISYETFTVGNEPTGLTGGAEANTNFDRNQPIWLFEIKGVELLTASGNERTTRIVVTAQDGAGNEGYADVEVTHALPEPPDPSEGLPWRDVKSKVTWFYNTTPQQQDQFSLNAVLELPPDFTMPCGVWDDPLARNRVLLYPHYTILTLFAVDPDDPDQLLPLWSTTVNSKDVSTCRDTKYRITAPKPGFREIYMEARSDNSITFYTFAEGLEFLPHKEDELGAAFPDFIRLIPGYVLSIVMDLSQDPDAGQIWEWRVGIGPRRSSDPQLSFEEFSTRTVVRYNR